ncbi:MAG: WbuC family cupin fold metalloprotein [Cyanobium sp.]
MRITIVGSGYIGQALARHWRQDPALRLTLTTTTPARVAALEPLAERVLVCRAGNPADLAAALEGAEAVVFCQAPGGSSQVDVAAYQAVYRNPFAALQELLPRLPALGTIIYTASSSVYGDAGGGWVDEDTPVEPTDEHGRILRQSEQLLEACREAGRRVCLLRLGAIHGPGRQPADRIARLAGTSRPGSGAHHSNWIHRDDVVGAIDMAMRQGWDGLVNLVDDRPWPVAELLAEVCAARGLEPVRWDAAPPQPGPSLAPPPPADRRIRNRRLAQLGYRLQHPQLRFPRLVTLDTQRFAAVAEHARQSPRLRRTSNLHRHEEPVQRFLNVLQPGTYVRPHRHLRELPGAGFECFVVLQGALGLLLLDEAGSVLECHRLEADGPLRGIELAEGQVHTLVALRDDTVMFEIKQGPYQPSADKDFLPQFPHEGTAEAAAWELRWRALFEAPAAG